MSQNGTHLGQVSTIVIPVSDQDTALAFYTQTLGMEKVNDFTYPTGERCSKSRQQKAAPTFA